LKLAVKTEENGSSQYLNSFRRKEFKKSAWRTSGTKTDKNHWVDYDTFRELDAKLLQQTI